MKLGKAMPVLVVCGAVAFAPFAFGPGPRAAQQPQGPGLGHNSWTVPVDVDHPQNPSQQDWYNLAWETFVALNWPAVAPSQTVNAGQPDTRRALGARAGAALVPTVWLTYRDLGSTMLAKGADPGPWDGSQELVPGTCAMLTPDSVAPGFSPMVLNMTSKFNVILPQDDIDEATNNPLVDQLGNYVIYDVRLNQSEYTYIWQNRYYDAANQVNAFTPPNQGIEPFPRTGAESSFSPPLPAYAQFGALEVKAAWRRLDPRRDVFSRYYTQVGYFLQPDGVTCEGPATFGLVGLHILRLTPTTPATWFWASFEQVDNTEITDPATRPDGSPLTPSLALPGTPNGNCGDTGQYNQAPGPVTANIPWATGAPPVNVCRETALGDDVTNSNRFWQGELQGTPWAYYRLINTINPSTQGGPRYSFPNNPAARVNTNIMANTSLETYAQQSSCMDCHAQYGVPQGVTLPPTPANQIFTFVLLNADSSDPTYRRGQLRLPHPAQPAESEGGCQTICFRAPQYWLLNLDRLPRGTITVAGVNAQTRINTTDVAAVELVLKGSPLGPPRSTPERFNRQYVAAQLSLVRAGGLGSAAAVKGQLSCYGLNFGPVSLGNNFTLSPGSTLNELFGQAQAALHEGRAGDLERLTEILGQLNGDDPLGGCGTAR